jgi:hypothetical protein
LIKLPKEDALSNFVKSFAKLDALNAPIVRILELSKFFYFTTDPFLIEILLKISSYLSPVVSSHYELLQCQVLCQQRLAAVHVAISNLSITPMSEAPHCMPSRTPLPGNIVSRLPFSSFYYSVNQFIIFYTKNN